MADPRIFLQTQPLMPIGNHYVTSTLQNKSISGNFQEILAKKSRQVTFSKHAQERLAQRQISFSESAVTRLEDTVARMAAKGAKESLVYLDGVALVVSVTNKKVITAMDGTSLKDNIFTNIDSAAII